MIRLLKMNRLLKNYLDTYLNNTFIETFYINETRTYYYRIRTNTDEIIKLVIPSDLDICYIYTQNTVVQSLYKINLITEEYHLIADTEEVYKFKDDYKFLNLYKIHPREIHNNEKIIKFIGDNIFNFKLLYEYKYLKPISSYHSDGFYVSYIPLTVTPVIAS